MTNKPNLHKADEKYKWQIQLENITSGGLIAISLVILQTFVSATSLDILLLIATCSFSIAIPILAGKLFLNFILSTHDYYLPSFRHGILRGSIVIGCLFAMIGIIATLWHISWIAALLFLASTILMYVLGALYFPHLIEIAEKEDK